MRKRLQHLGHWIIGNREGSALVGAFALSMILSIASLGYLQVVSSASNSGNQHLRDTEAFLAAESGLLLGTQWLQDPSTAWPAQSGSTATLYSGLIINGVSVDVRDSVGAGGQVFILAQASTSKLPYIKKVNWAVTRGTIPGGAYGVYMDNAYQLGGNSSGIRKMDLWDGPLHSNTALQLGNPGGGNESHFNGPVTVHNIDPATNQPIYDASHGTGHFGNDYRYGVEGGSGNWDSEFQNTYDANASLIRSGFDANGKTDITLNANDSGVVFGVDGAGNPYYRYKNAGGAVTTTTYDPNTDLKLHIVGQGAEVSGSLKGKVSVYTDNGKDIYLPGSLTYADFSTTSFSSTDISTNSGFGFSSTNVLGLYSGKDFVVSEGAHYITGQLFATRTSTTTLKYENDKKSKSQFYLFGSLAVSGFWDSGQGNDQAVFKQLWDRRQSAAPGMGYNRVDANGNALANFTRINWTNTNTAL